MIASMALAVTWRGDRSARARSAVLLAAVAAVTLFVCLAASAALMVSTVNQRAVERTFRHAAPHEEPDLRGRAIYDSVGGEQIFVYLWHVETPGVHVGGLPADAEAGEWFVSPELARRIEDEPSLRSRYPGAREIGAEGVGSADELVAVRLAEPDAEFDFEYVAQPGSEHSGLDAGVSLPQVAAGAAVVMVACIGLLRAALGPADEGLERRAALLSALGATRARLWLLHTASVAVVAAPAASGAAVAWYFAAPRLRAVPFVGQTAVQGDLAVPPGAAAAAAAAVVALAVLVAWRRPSALLGTRPARPVPEAPTLWRILPLAAALATVGYATARSGTSGAPGPFITGLVAAALAVPFAIPVLIHRIGDRLAAGSGPGTAGSAVALLAGRSLSSSARSSARTLTAVASLTVMVPAAASYVAVARAADPLPPRPALEAIEVGGELSAEEVATLERDADGVFAEIYRADLTGPSNRAPTITLVADCASLERFGPLLECGPDGIRVDAEAAPWLARFDEAVAEAPAGATASSLLFITDDPQHADNVLRTRMVNSDSGLRSVSGPADAALKESRSVKWIIAAIGVGAAAALAALALSIVSDASRCAGLRLRLVGIGADLRTIRRMAAAESAATVGIVGLAGVAVGTAGAVAYALTDGSVTPRWEPSLVLAAAVAAAAAMAAAASALSVTEARLRRALDVGD